MPGILAPSIASSFWGSAYAIIGQGFLDALKGHRHAVPQRGGVIDLSTGTVDVAAANPKYCERNKPFCTMQSANLTARLRSPPSASYTWQGGKEWRLLTKTIDKYRSEAMAQRYRPMTPTESQAWGQSTPSMQALLAQTWGRMGGRITQRRRRRGSKKKVARKSYRRSSRRAPRGKAHLVKGSLAARRHMARLRKLAGRARRRKSRQTTKV